MLKFQIFIAIFEFSMKNAFSLSTNKPSIGAQFL